MAVAILGGLLTSMLLNLVALPTLALAFGRFEPRSQDPDSLAKDAMAKPSAVS